MSSTANEPSIECAAAMAAANYCGASAEADRAQGVLKGAQSQLEKASSRLVECLEKMGADPNTNTVQEFKFGSYSAASARGCAMGWRSGQ